MRISFIVPAYNEEVMLGATLATLADAARSLALPFEVVVVNDASTDRTAAVARTQGAQVLDVDLHKIGAVRNAGARIATGDLLVFVDADTLVATATLREMMDAVRQGAVGGGARVRLDLHGVSRGWRVLAEAACWALFRLGFAGGCFLFARREAFEAAGGFDERYFASEEIHLRIALAKRGRFVMVPHPVLSSGRKLRLFSAGTIARQMLRFAVGGFAMVRRREGLDLWYDGRRESSDVRPPLER
jgi:glycosyltransferase involved in cell wall biosynthesis